MASLTLSIGELEVLLAEDAPHGDLTTEALAIGDRPAVMTFTARADLVVAGIGVAAGLVRVAGGAARILVEDGRAVSKGTALLAATGSAGALHRAWKQAQTTVELLSGIATAARAVVLAAEVDGRRVPVACTRKALAGSRRLMVAAIRAGGCASHRLGLSETVLVFAEHRAFLPDENLAAMVARLRAAAPEKKLAIEVAEVAEAVAAATAGFDVLQLEKFPPERVAEVVARVRPIAPGIVVAAAGGIDPTNASAYAAAGADVLVTSWPYTARPRDVQVLIEPA